MELFLLADLSSSCLSLHQTSFKYHSWWSCDRLFTFKDEIENFDL